MRHFKYRPDAQAGVFDGLANNLFTDLSTACSGLDGAPNDQG